MYADTKKKTNINSLVHLEPRGLFKFKIWSNQ